MGSYVSDLVHEVLTGVELELVCILLYLAPLFRYFRFKSNVGILDFSLLEFLSLNPKFHFSTSKFPIGVTKLEGHP